MIIKQRSHKRQERRIGQYFAPINRNLHQPLLINETQDTITQGKPLPHTKANTVHWKKRDSNGHSQMNSKLKKKHN